jgi:hypothetical protein
MKGRLAQLLAGCGPVVLLIVAVAAWGVSQCL